MGQVGRFRSEDGRQYPRGTAVICRTSRGIELGEVLTSSSDASPGAVDGQLLRAVTAEDQLLKARLDRHQRKAFRACERLIRERDLPVALVDIELLFDGQSLYFYFLGDVTEEVEVMTQGLAKEYEAKAGIGKFAKLLTDGCGPGCGTVAGGGCQTTGGGCAGCAASGGCGTSSSRASEAAR